MKAIQEKILESISSVSNNVIQDTNGPTTKIKLSDHHHLRIQSDEKEN